MDKITILEQTIENQEELIKILKEQIKTHESIRQINEEHIRVLKTRIELLVDDILQLKN